jgi:hypothetical protein
MTVVANWRGSGLGPIVPTDIKYTAKNVHPMIQPIIRIKKKIGRTNIIGVLYMKELVTFMIATASLILLQQIRTIRANKPSRPQRMYAPYYK